jgi:transcriptional regulator with XRE-family HTH domain
MPSDLPDWVVAQRRRIGARVRALRAARGLSQERLAELAEVSRKSVYRTELATHAASIDVLIRVARALGVPLRELFDPPSS